jgi:hypothetical protein
MHIYTECRFCYSELKQPQTMRKAFCDGYCRSLHGKHGNIRNMQIGKTVDPTPNRKTTRRNTRKGTHKPVKETFVTLVQASDGSTHQQFNLILDYPATVTPLVLTGGSINAPGRKNEDKDKDTQA